MSHSDGVPAKLRHGLEPLPVRNPGGRLLIGLRDPLGLADGTLCLPEDLLFILRYLDGGHSGIEIRAEYLRRFGTFLFKDRYLSFLQQLDDNYLLDNDNARMRIEELTRIYRESPFRQPCCAGASYPADPAELDAMMSGFARQVRFSSGVADRCNRETIRAAVVPHIDLRAGGVACAHAYQLLAQDEAADLYVILGIGHQGLTSLFSVTGQSFNTPFGPATTDIELVRRIDRLGERDYRSDELAHRSEHSIEFQTLFLKKYIRSEFKILPILSSFGFSIIDEKDGGDRETYQDFINALRTALSDYAGRICYIASVDFAHVGPRYGDAAPPDAVLLAQVERNDRTLLDALSRGDRGAFQQQIQSTGDRYRVCGYSALVTLMDLLDWRQGELLHYERAVMDDARSTVSFASMVFY